ncbi:cytochrome P450 6j1-like [Bacillus rossius redtenbacheri]|uniref:cytochrome P450 6j1-like n=1 Tax=Bacillus rossius redtenbacheri TaxID=93214 RepID=UPI002FDE8C33
MAVVFGSLLADLALVVAIVFLVLYLYCSHAFKYWERRGVCYAPPTMFFGNMGRFILQLDSLGNFLHHLYEQHKGQPAVGIFASTRPVLVALDLDLVRAVLVKDAHAFLDRSFSPPKEAEPLLARSLFVLKGKKWRHMRIKLTPTFTSGKLKKMFHLVNKCGKELLSCIDQEISKAGGSVSVKDTVARYSTDVIASCAFGVDANALADPNCEFRVTMRKMFEPNAIQKLANIIAFMAPWLRKIISLSSVDDSINKFVRGTFWNVVDFRRKNSVVRKDFVDILMQIKDDGEVHTEDAKDFDEIKQDSKYMDMDYIKAEKSDIKLEDDDIVAQAFIFIIAGFETSSSVISFTLLELALNPSIQDRLREEIQSVLNKYNSEVTYDSISEMTYLDMVISEAMRKYPTVPVLERKCQLNYKIQNTNIVIEKGTGVMIPVLGIHYDPLIYPQPHTFDPERFSPEKKKERSHFSHLPFGEGPRICIGMRFGMIQVKTALVHILTAYQVRPCAQTPELPLEMKPFGVLTPKKEIILDFRKIKYHSP